MRTLAYVAFSLSSLLTACTQSTVEEDGAADIQGDDAKEDGGPGIEVTARIKPGTVDASLSAAVPRRGYVFYAAEGAKVSLEVTRTGSSAGLDTIVKVYGPRLADGTYPKTVATDEDAGYGKLSKVGALDISTPGFYLAEVSFSPNTTPADGKVARVKLACDGTCDSALPIQTDLGLTWYRRSAERRALTAQAYRVASDKLEARVAGITGAWGVVLDIDETTLNNSTYQAERMALGLGYSSASWTEWVNRKAATPIDGVTTFLQKVKTLGGKVVFVTNRLAATECSATADNVAAAGIAYDAMLCKTETSDKNPRFATVAADMKIVMFVGDNILDFPALSQDLRSAPAAEFSKFGEEYFLLPNSMYGSWEKNVGDNAL